MTAKVLMRWFLGVVFGPYGPRNLTRMFTWQAADNVSPALGPRMGLLYFSGHAW